MGLYKGELVSGWAVIRAEKTFENKHIKIQKLVKGIRNTSLNDLYFISGWA